MKNNTIKILFNINASNSWIGGLNYYKNLFIAISKVENPKLLPLIDSTNELPEELKRLAHECDVLSKKEFKYYIKWILNHLFKKSYKLNNIKKIYLNYSLSSHCPRISRKPNIQWIPDFQHIYLPELFSKEECINRNKSFYKIAKDSDIVLLSSEDAKNDFIKCFPQYKSKARVLHFVSYFSRNLYKETDDLNVFLKKKFNLPEKYFYLPNQFWKHKNHLSVFKAVALLKKQGVDIHVVCTGNTNDYRNPEYYKDLLQFITDENIQNNIHILGIVDYKEVVYLLRYSLAVIQPSLFEGWSSIIEEAKSIGKNCILSNINVHREQEPEESIYFDPLNIKSLAEILKNNYEKLHPGPNLLLEEKARKAMEQRIKEFGQTYQKYVLELV